MLPRIEFEQLTFGTPEYLWLLLVPALLVALWGWRFARRRADARRVVAGRVLPVRQRLAFFGDSPFWLVLIAAVASVIVALARPQGPATVLRDDAGSARPKTSHTLNRVPFYVYAPGAPLALSSRVEEPGLANLAATVLQLLGFAPPEGYAPSLLAE